MAPPAAENNVVESSASARDTTSAPTTTKKKTKPASSSSPEEIARQHALAVALIQKETATTGRSYPKPTWEGEIPLIYKQRPVVAQQEQEDDDDTASSSIPVWSSRGQVDVSALQKLVGVGYNRKYNLKNVKRGKKNGITKTTATTATKTEPTTATTTTTTIANFWDPQTAATHNVSLCRPSHDAWGIPKIVLIFCDDFLQTVYEFPWLETFRDALQPILQVVLNENNKKEEDLSKDCRIVRMLLASLPHGTTIPVHFDTGEWVKHTHRIHVPVLVQDNTGSKIVFQCGATVDTLQAIECRPGHVFEINNQAQHTVSNCGDDYRVHLILDYVDEDNSKFCIPKERVRLQPGEVLLQTRRSVDRLACKGQRPTPSFFILGAQKAGTTFLFELIMQHPLLVRPRHGRRETHCLDWRWNEQLENAPVAQQQDWCRRQFYHYDELQLHPSCLTGDSTPSYLMDSARVIPRLQRVFFDEHSSNSKCFFVTCRDPVQRAESHYAMVTSPHGTAAQLKARGSEWRRNASSFENIVWDDVRKLQQCGLIPYWKIMMDDDNDDDLRDSSAELDSESITDRLCNHSQFDPDVFQAFSGSAAEDEAWKRYIQTHIPLHTGSYGLLSRGLYELNLRPWFRAFAPDDFLVLKLEAMKDAAANLHETLAQVWQHLGVPSITVDDQTPRNARDYAPIVTDRMKDFLQHFYEPHNRRLLQLLSEQQQKKESKCWKLHWSESWNYSR